MAVQPETVRNKTTLNTCVEDTALPLVLLTINQHFLKAG